MKIERRFSKQEKVNESEEGKRRRRRAQRPGQSFVRDPWVAGLRDKLLPKMYRLRAWRTSSRDPQPISPLTRSGTLLNISALNQNWTSTDNDLVLGNEHLGW